MSDYCRVDLLDGRASALSHRLLVLRDALTALSATGNARRNNRDRCRQQVRQAEECLNDVREVTESYFSEIVTFVIDKDLCLMLHLC